MSNKLIKIALIGITNAGKSTFLRAISAAKPKVAAYPFTTLAPELGVFEAGPDSTLVVADIPGFDVDITPKRIFSSATKSFRTVKFIYRLKMEWKNTRAMAPPNTIIVHLPFTEEIVSIPPYKYIEQYNIYHLLQASAYQREERMKRDLYKAKHGEKG